jgi:CO/xanthine dehydrogenase FAD-binding subunit
MSSLYFSPTTADEVVRILSEHPGARVVAGGTDLVVQARNGRRPLPDVLIAIHRVAELGDSITADDGDARLGALTTHSWLEHSPIVGVRWTALADAAALVGSPATRNTGTLGGNIMNASPAMDTGAPLLVLQAIAELRGTDGRRDVSLDALLAAPGQTNAEPDELLTAVRLPAPGYGAGSAYVRLEYRRAMELAVVGAAAFLQLDEGGSICEARVALSAVAPTCVRTPDAEVALLGERPEPQVLGSAAKQVAAYVRPITDVRGSDEYRRAMTPIVASRALTVAAARAAGNTVPVPANRSLPAAHLGSTR